MSVQQQERGCRAKNVVGYAREEQPSCFIPRTNIIQKGTSLLPSYAASLLLAQRTAAASAAPHDHQRAASEMKHWVQKTIVTTPSVIVSSTYR